MCSSKASASTGASSLSSKSQACPQFFPPCFSANDKPRAEVCIVCFAAFVVAVAAEEERPSTSATELSGKSQPPSPTKVSATLSSRPPALDALREVGSDEAPGAAAAAAHPSAPSGKTTPDDQEQASGVFLTG